MNGIHEVTGSIPVWSTKFPNSCKCLYIRGLSGSIAPNASFAKTLISNDFLFRPNRDRTGVWLIGPNASFSLLLVETDVDQQTRKRLCVCTNSLDRFVR